jgi:hypothetical protein
MKSSKEWWDLVNNGSGYKENIRSRQIFHGVQQDKATYYFKHLLLVHLNSKATSVLLDLGSLIAPVQLHLVVWQRSGYLLCPHGGSKTYPLWLSSR